MDILTIISMACTFGMWYISNERKKKIEELEEENKHLQAEIDQLKRASTARQNFDNLCQEIEDKLADTRQ